MSADRAFTVFIKLAASQGWGKPLIWVATEASPVAADALATRIANMVNGAGRMVNLHDLAGHMPHYWIPTDAISEIYVEGFAGGSVA